MQGKLVIRKGDGKKLQSAAYFKNVKIGDSVTIGDETHVEISFKEVQNLWDCREMFDKVDGTELDAIKAKKEAKEKAALEAKKPVKK